MGRVTAGRVTRRIPLGIGGVALVLAATLAGCSPSGQTADRPSVSSAPGSAPVGGQALSLLARLQVGAVAPASRYQRTAFGQAWADTDRNGCDTHNDVLRRDLRSAVVKPGTHGCKVMSGVLDDPYTGAKIPYLRDGSGAIQVDHVVALGNAWRTGASSWPYAELLAFANDPLELVAVSGKANNTKSDSDAAGWLPANGAYRCPYAARQVAVKVKYRLRVTDAEHDALLSVLKGCPGQRVPVGAAPTLAPNRSPRPSAAAASPVARQQGTDPDYGSCAKAKAHGAGPYTSGRDPEFAFYNDGDGDGVVCE